MVPGVGNTDSVPALLTPGEFVINKTSAQQVGYETLERLNKVRKFAKGGPVKMATGGTVGGGKNVYNTEIGPLISPEIISSLSRFATDFSAAVEKLNNMQLSVKLDPTNVNVNFNNTSFLQNLTDTIRNSVLDAVSREIPKYKVDNTGTLSKNPGV